jgi:uncharacterized membrane protein
MSSIFDVLSPKQAAVVITGGLSLAVGYALVKGEVFLMPYSVSRKQNPRAFYVLLAIIVVALAVSISRAVKAYEPAAAPPNPATITSKG